MVKKNAGTGYEELDGSLAQFSAAGDIWPDCDLSGEFFFTGAGAAGGRGNQSAELFDIWHPWRSRSRAAVWDTDLFHAVGDREIFGKNLFNCHKKCFFQIFLWTNKKKRSIIRFTIRRGERSWRYLRSRPSADAGRFYQNSFFCFDSCFCRRSSFIFLSIRRHN